MGRPADVDIPVYQGDRLEFYVRLREQVWSEGFGKYIPGDYIDLTGLTGRGDVKASKDNPSVVCSFDITVDNQVNPDTKGGFTAVLTPAKTAALTLREYVYDIQFSSSATDIETYLAGRILVEFEVTKGA